MKLTAVYVKVPEGYAGFVEELPGANTQGETLEEARENLQEAVELVLEANRTLADFAGPRRDSRRYAGSDDVKRIDLVRHLENQGCEFPVKAKSTRSM